MVSLKLWGPAIWKSIHYITMGYPENPTSTDKENYKNFLTMYKNVLPCNMCSINYEKHLLINPLTEESLSSRNNLVKWGIDMHNIVNKMLNKPILNYDQAYDVLNKQPTNNYPILLYIIIIILCLIIISIII